jgi:hypothetical protein
LKLPTYNGTKNLRTTGAIKVIIFKKQLEPQWLQCIFLTNFVVFWTKSWGILGNSFSPSVNSTNFAIFGKFRQFFDITQLEGK